jgi:hypothetical protein
MRREPRFRTAPEGAIHLDNSVLFDVAVNAALKINAPHREGGENNALVSVAFSIITLEAFLNETIEIARNAASLGTSNPIVSLFVHVMNAMERSSLEDKFGAASVLLEGKPVDFGAAPYQDLSLLVSLRNELVHFKPNPRITYRPNYQPVREKLLKQLKSKNILAEEVQYAEGWLFHVSTRALAEWACKTAGSVIEDFMTKALVDGRLSPYVAAGPHQYSHDYFSARK